MDDRTRVLVLAPSQGRGGGIERYVAGVCDALSLLDIPTRRVALTTASSLEISMGHPETRLRLFAAVMSLSRTHWLAEALTLRCSLVAWMICDLPVAGSGTAWTHSRHLRNKR